MVFFKQLNSGGKLIVFTGPATEMIAAMVLDEIFNLKGLGTPQSSLFGQFKLW